MSCSKIRLVWSVSLKSLSLPVVIPHVILKVNLRNVRHLSLKKLHGYVLVIKCSLFFYISLLGLRTNYMFFVEH